MSHFATGNCQRRLLDDLNTKPEREKDPLNIGVCSKKKGKFFTLKDQRLLNQTKLIVSLSVKRSSIISSTIDRITKDSLQTTDILLKILKMADKHMDILLK